MSDETTLLEAPKATLFVQRSVKVRDYESLVVGMHYPVDLPIFSLYDGDSARYYADLDKAIRDGYTTVKGHIFDQLGLEYEDKNGVMTEKVTAAFKGAAEVQTAPAAQRATAPASAPAAGMPTSCACGGTEFYDNRPKKAAGTYKPSSPDFKCKGCGKGIWPDKK